MLIHPDRLFPAEPAARGGAQALCGRSRSADRVAAWPYGSALVRRRRAFSDPATLFVIPDHYIFRMLYSQGVRLEDLGIATKEGGIVERDPRDLAPFRGALPSLSRHADADGARPHLRDLFGFTERLTAANADEYYDKIDAALSTPNSARARCSSASASRPSPRRRARSIR